MREDLDKRMKLRDRFAKLISLGLWSNSIAQPDGQILERIQRLNDDIEQQIKELYIPENQIDSKIKSIKKELHEEFLKSKPVTTKKQGVDQEKGLHLGKSVSNCLNQTEEDTQLLKKSKLPSLKTLDDLSSLLETKPSRLIWLIFHNDVTDTVHYTDFKIPKGRNSTRTISEPCNALKSIQYHVKSKVLDKISFPDYIFGFVKGHNILDNAKVHVKANSLINIDIKDFFPSITFKQVRQAFQDLGYSGFTSTILSLLCTKQDQQPIEIEGKKYWKMSEHRYLPQGASTSPAVSNLVASKFDNQMFVRASKIDFRYTRYADDLTFSTNSKEPNHKAILYMAKKTLELHGFEVNPNKVKILFQHNQQQITGININSGKPTIPRTWRRKLRAAVHQFRFIKDEDEKEMEFNRIMGSLQFLKLTHPKLAKQYEIEVNRYNQIS